VSGMPTPKRPKKKPFDLEEAIVHLREAVASYPKAALFELYADGYTSVFEVLVACVISIRTRDETTNPVARRLFAAARQPAKIASLSVQDIDTLIAGWKTIRGGPPTRSDIDFRIDAAHPKASELIKDLQGVGNGAGTAGPDWTTNPMTPGGRPTVPPLIRFNLQSP
jgi:hypothetical protein